MNNKETIIYIVRHGQSEGNKIDKFVGHTDLGLTDLGKTQAELTAKCFVEKGILLDTIYSSDLKRAIDTANPTAKAYNLELQKLKQLREINGGKWEGMIFPDIVEKYPKEYDVWKNNFWQARPVGGESITELAKRIVDAIEKIAIQNEGKKVAVFTHATPLRIAICHYSNKQLSQLNTIPWVSNASITTLKVDSHKSSLEQIGYDLHLGNLTSTFAKEV